MTRIYGTNSAEKRYGGADNDSVFGYDGNDSLYGYGGDDYLNGGRGRDYLAGGPGDDRYVVDNTRDTVFEVSGGGSDVVYAYADFTLPAHVETLYLSGSASRGAGNALDNSIAGTGHADWLDGLGGNDIIYGYDGDNYLYGGSGNDYLYGGAGRDHLYGGTGGDYLWGGAGNDNYAVDSSGDRVVEAAGGGLDSVDAYVDHVLAANVENLVLYGVAETGWGNMLNNTVSGTGGHNWLRGLDGNDRLYGFGGNDILDGGTGADYLWGGSGDDSYNADNVSDIVEEAKDAGRDTIYTSVTNYVLPANVERLHLSGAATGGFGNGLDNVITGTEGSDSLFGRGGNDALYGEGGNDRLAGGIGNDVLYGSAGNDRFVFEETGNSNKDTIVGFSHFDDSISFNDQLDGTFNSAINGLSFNNGVLNSGFYFEGAGVTGSGAESSGIYNDTRTGTIWYNPTSGIRGDSVAIAIVGSTVASTLDSSDFVFPWG